MEIDREKIKKLPKWAQELIRELEISSQDIGSAYTPEPFSRDEIYQWFEAREDRSILLKGYFFNGFNGTITYGCTNTIYHSKHNSERTDTQNCAAGLMYRSRGDAIIACQNEIAREFKLKIYRLKENVSR